MSAERFPADLDEAMRLQRRAFLRSPLSSTLVTVWRAATRKVPCIGRLVEQDLARRQIHGLLGSPSSSV